MNNAWYDNSMAELFRREIESQSAVLTEGLLALERDPSARHKLTELMRAAHSLKGAARIVGCEAAVRIAHAMEDCFVAARERNGNLTDRADTLLSGVDLLGRIAQASEESFVTWGADHESELQSFLASLERDPVSLDESRVPRLDDTPESTGGSVGTPPPGTESDNNDRKRGSGELSGKPSAGSDRVLRVTAENLSRLLGLAGETLVASRWLENFVTEMVQLRQLHRELAGAADDLHECISEQPSNSRAGRRLGEVRDRVARCNATLMQRVDELDLFDRRFASFSKRLYQEVLDCRLRPFADGVQVFPRMVRDLGKSLGKTVTLRVTGESTAVDRDILERIKAPLDHLLRNAIDHGVEPPEERLRRGKAPGGTIRLEAAHSAGKLLVTVSDDGSGIDLGAIRDTVVRQNLSTAEIVQKMTDAELLEFLFLPGFTLKDAVSEISGRGVGLDVVQTMVKEVGGNVRISSTFGVGTRFQLELPLTLSMVRTLLVEIGGEPYAFPLARVETTLKLPLDRIQSAEGRQHFSLGQRQIGVVAGCEILELDSTSCASELSIVVLGDKGGRYGIVVDRFLGERELVVRSLDPRLGKVKNISAAALMPDGSPLLIVDVDDLMREIDNFLSGNRLSQVGPTGAPAMAKERKRVLVVDDSLTVRELERKLLDGQGYAVDIAVDGMDGWNAVRTGHYHLVVTDIDMPRLDGIELVTLIRKDSRLKSLPIMIVSYKDRPEDRQRGLEAGADYYLTKGSFHDETLLRAVADLIGDVQP
jgi:two-component system, chemotaxis family, sensor histidine kinase and response regulator WspE